VFIDVVEKALGGGGNSSDNDSSDDDIDSLSIAKNKPENKLTHFHASCSDINMLNGRSYCFFLIYYLFDVQNIYVVDDFEDIVDDQLVVGYYLNNQMAQE